MILETVLIIAIIALVLGSINLIFSIVILRKVRFNEYRISNQIKSEVRNEGIVFCTRCNNKYSASLQKCPTCGEKRKR